MSEPLSKLFPEVEDGGGSGCLGQEDDQKINELSIPELTEILSKIDKGEVPNQFEFFHGFKGNEDKKYDVLTNKNSKYLFNLFNGYLEQIFEPIKPVCHGVINDDDLALEVIQNKNLQFFIETILTTCKTNYGGINNTSDLKDMNLIKNSVESITIYK